LQKLKSKIIHGDCVSECRKMPENSVDLLATDQPYGYNFMGMGWDNCVPPADTWREVLRVMKPGAMGFVMCSPRQDVKRQTLNSLHDAGFYIKFPTIFWTYASGFNKSANAAKMADDRSGKPGHYEGDLAPRKSKDKYAGQLTHEVVHRAGLDGVNASKYVPATLEGKNLDAAYLGFQPKPAVEEIFVVMKPLSEGTFIAQAMKDRKGVTWLNDCRIPAVKPIGSRPTAYSPFAGDHVSAGEKGWGKVPNKLKEWKENDKGRFPANLVVSDDVLCDAPVVSGDCESFSEYFSNDLWWARYVSKLLREIRDTFPFLVVTKSQKKEKEKGLSDFPLKLKPVLSGATRPVSLNQKTNDGNRMNQSTMCKNDHPTVKPVKLFCWLLKMGSRMWDVVLDPFAGSGTTGIAARITRRKYILIEKELDYYNIARKRISAEVMVDSLLGGGNDG
jgi:site-specific DNA-methyltransferase (adenine-specific)